MRFTLTLATCLVLVACARTPPGCDARALRALDAEIAATERALATGQRFEPARDGETRLRLCAWPKAPVLFCTERVQTPQSARHVPVDVASEQVRLTDLRARRGALATSCTG